MKNFFKMALVIIMAAFLCGAGFYLTLVNTSRLLAAGKPDLQCHWMGSGLRIKAAKWYETIHLLPLFYVRSQSGQWLIYNRKFALIVSAKPLRIQWEKSFPGNEIRP